MGCLATQRYALRVAVLFPTSALVLWFPSTIDADTNAASAISATLELAMRFAVPSHDGPWFPAGAHA